MASVLWLDFDGAALAEPLTSTFVAQFRTGQTSAAGSEEEAVIEAVGACGLSDEQLSDFAKENAEPAAGLLELWDWIHWNGWHMAIGGVTFDLLMDPVLDSVGLDRVARHCGRAETLYRRQLRFLSPRGVEIRSNFVAAYIGSYRNTGDFVVYVGGHAAGVDHAAVAHAAFLTTIPGGQTNVEDPLILRWESLSDVTAHLEKEGDAWRASFSSTTAAEG